MVVVMKWYKKLFLGLSILSGVLTTAKDGREFGLFTMLILFVIFALTTLFLWRWASGKVPGISAWGAVGVLLLFVIASVLILNVAMAGQFHVNIVEVLRVSIMQKPLFYVLAIFGAALKVLIWKWLFSEVRTLNAVTA